LSSLWKKIYARGKKKTANHGKNLSQRAEENWECPAGEPVKERRKSLNEWGQGKERN